MTRAALTTVLVFAYGALVLAVAIWAHRRTHQPRDYYVGDRRAGPALLAFSQAVHILPAWAMLFVSGAAFASGYAAAWLALGFWMGGLLQVFFAGPRSRALAGSQHSVSLTHLLTFDTGERMQRNLVRLATAFLILTLSAIVIAQLQLIEVIAQITASGRAINVVSIGLFLLIAATAGWWALALLESIHAVLLALVCLITPLIAWAALESWDAIAAGMRILPTSFAEFDGGRKNVVAVAFVAGVLSFLWIPLGQPTLVNRAIAARDARAEALVRWVLLGWLTLTLSLLLVIGWFGRVLYDGLSAPQNVMFEIHTRLLHPAVPVVVGVIVIAALLTNVAAQLAALSTALLSDLRPTRGLPSNEWSRAMTGLLVIASLALAYFAKSLTLNDLVFCWTALAASLAPLLLVKLTGKRVRGGSMLGAMSAGFILVCVFHMLPDAPGDFLERVLPFVASLGIALSGGERRRNPDRADRKDETVHDRLPI